MNVLITVPEPCNQSWADMLPAENGRHCLSCEKTVIDFTGWELPEIVDYLRNNGKACGQFKRSQLNTPIKYTPEAWVSTIASGGYTFLQKIALIFLVAFGLLAESCGSDSESASLSPRDTLVAQQAASGDLSSAGGVTESVLVGEAPMVVDSSKNRNSDSICSAGVKGKTVLRPGATGTDRQVGGAVRTVPAPPEMVGGAPMVVPAEQFNIRGDVALHPDSL